MSFYITKTIGIGRTPELSLRVSAGVLNRVEMPHPDTGETLIVLEKKLTSRFNKNYAVSNDWILQPLGGSSRLHQPQKLQEVISRFHFEDEWAKENQDFRLYIRPHDLEKVVHFTEYHFENKELDVIRLNAKHEFYEELLECLGTYQKEHTSLKQLIAQISTLFNLTEEGFSQAVQFKPFDRKKYKDLESLRRLHPETIHRIYNHIHHITIHSENISRELLNLQNSLKNADIEDVAERKTRWRNLRNGRPRTYASGLFITPLKKILDHYQNHPKSKRGLINFYEHYPLSENVAQMFESDLEP